MNRSNFNGTHICNNKTMMIGIHINAEQSQRNTKFSDIKWIPKIDGIWYVTQIFSGFVYSEGYQITIKNDTLTFKHIDANGSGVALIAIYELYTN